MRDRERRRDGEKGGREGRARSEQSTYGITMGSPLRVFTAPLLKPLGLILFFAGLLPLGGVITRGTFAVEAMCSTTAQPTRLGIPTPLRFSRFGVCVV